MATRDKWVNVALKRFLSQNRIAENIINYLKNIGVEALRRSFPESGLFTFPVTITPDGAASTFDLSPFSGTVIEGADNNGKLLSLTGAVRFDDIPFENTPAARYWIGMKYATVPDFTKIYLNPRTGVPEYDLWEEEIGELDVPSAVTDLGGSIQLVVDSICENGVDYSGRSVDVWLINPMSNDLAVAFETLTITYDGGSGENRVTTAGLLGQGTVSTSINDYQVYMGGCTWKKGVANPLGDEYVQFGYIDGGNPATANVDNQKDYSGGSISLQRAYDGAGGGSGRRILAANQAVLLEQLNITNREKDIANAVLRINKDKNSLLPSAGFNSEQAIDIVSRLISESNLSIRASLSDTAGNDELRKVEDVDLATNVVTFTRGGVDLTLAGSTYSSLSDRDLLEIEDDTLGNAGIYKIVSLLAGSCVVKNLDDTAVSFAVEAGNSARIFRSTLKLGGGNQIIEANSIADFYGDFGTPIDTVAAIELIYNLGAADQQLALRIGKPPYTTDYFSVTSRGEITAGGGIALVEDITTSNGNIIIDTGYLQLSLGNIVVSAGNIGVISGSITVSDGDIWAVSGDVKIVTGNLEITTGNIEIDTGDIAITSGSINLTVGNLNIDAGNINLYNGGIDISGNFFGGSSIQTTSGLIKTANGNIEAADGDVLISNSNNYRFDSDGTPKTVYRNISVSDACPAVPIGMSPHLISIGGTAIDVWFYRTNYTSPKDILEAGSGDAEINIPVKLPIGAVLIDMKMIVDHIGTTPALVIFFGYHAYNMSLGSTNTFTTLGSKTINTAGQQVRNFGLGSHVVLENADYLLKINAGVTSDKLLAFRIQYELTNLLPNAT